ncbi:uncharacterized protein LOC105194318 isoform X2 [Solenopsis invicta]|uniref:uncharacterized protein LOC105194318 isoform X2 n=1 Tax=Solenopsis invicta TaxID=13686 RepID=UPI000E33F4F9|nr:uncharacterized protein LOC105194318 isoform X2 [Solenopsis invicta]
MCVCECVQVRIIRTTTGIKRNNIYVLRCCASYCPRTSMAKWFPSDVTRYEPSGILRRVD